jgi:hypothetical protein
MAEAVLFLTAGFLRLSVWYDGIKDGKFHGDRKGNGWKEAGET